MKKQHLLHIILGSCLAALLPSCVTGPAPQSTKDVSYQARTALQDLYAKNPAARKVGASAKAVIVFPNVAKAGFVVGGHHGNGVLIRNGGTAGYYNTTAVSYGLQAGVQSYGYALFLMNDRAIAHVNATGGWDLGLSPSLVVVDQGMAKNWSTNTLHKDIYAFVFNQNGLMGGSGIQTSKITRLSDY